MSGEHRVPRAPQGRSQELSIWVSSASGTMQTVFKISNKIGDWFGKDAVHDGGRKDPAIRNAHQNSSQLTAEKV